MNIMCFLRGHRWEPRRFQQTPDPRYWIHQCARCGTSRTERTT